ncbi:NAD-glutamate dehydrogenase [Kineococcus radiotolerans]|uniref:NAD-glutamate dehydrogenase n=1 Tax=Kineococcus radiotolerans (strain ATCC BAA-149 / DSM 14245 / SRS30216) TaxID=266940 RepID=A6WEM1_KINRD|nr:NAD-glutamate dehydrogenase [Kineococcus radiotolerans]ABS05260.1 NAD-glutamate dehydrogenase [Kineococcus radiotolerans SRS30216 = ATCC BAA-149]
MPASTSAPASTVRELVRAAVADRDPQWGDGLPDALRGGSAPERLLLDYFAHTAVEDLADHDPAELATAVVSHVRSGLRRAPGTTLVRVVDGVDSGAGAGRSTVEVVTDDMPFLVDSLTAALTRSGRGIHLLVHPRLAAKRDDDGVLLDLHDVGTAPPSEPAESWIRIEVDRHTGEGADGDGGLLAELRAVLDDVRAAVNGWQPMRARALQIADALQIDPPRGVAETELRVAERFLRWMADDRFTFLGYREYDLRTSGDDVVLAARSGTGLGVLADRPGRAGGRERTLSGPVRDKATEPQVLVVTKANARATVHRPAFLDYVGVKTFDEQGRVVGERRFLGLFTSVAYTDSVKRVPVVAEKVNDVLQRAGFGSSGHSAKDLLSILETFPRDELLQSDVGSILSTAMAVLRLQERRRTRLFLRRDDYRRFMSCLVYLPRDRYTTRVGARIEASLLEAFDGGSVESTLRVSESVLARLHVVVRARAGEELSDVDVSRLEADVARAARSWDDDLADAARAQLGDREGAALVARWAGGIPNGYRAAVDVERATRDLIRAGELLAAGGEVPVLDLREDPDQPRTWRFTSYRTAPVTLSAVLPVLTDLGVEVTDERPHVVTRDDGRTVHIDDVGLRLPVDVWQLDADPAAARTRFREAFAAAWTGRAESDALARLVLAGQLDWRQVAVLRALVRYLRQVGLAYSLDYVANCLLADVGLTRLIVRLFEARFAPTRPGHEDERAELVDALVEETHGALEGVDGLDADRILRALLSVVRAVVRTNAYQSGPDGRPHEHLSFKLSPRLVAGMPEPAPHAEVWVYSPRVEGVHLRFGEVARGGLRWSDRREDFRTEVLGLVKAQIVKNAVIVPTGAKGGFVAKRLPDPSVDRDAWWAEGIASYRTFISGLLDITDDLRVVEDEQGRQVRVTVPPVDVVRYDGDDSYLVVAADKGTASFSDIANEIAVSRGFWLGDAFASGGSVGYDHKAMGITARGAWESVRRHFRELGHDTQTQEFTVVGVGDMSGDVFGNGMLLSDRIRLVAAFDHRHVFLDPDPDPASSHAERARLFALPRSSWEDYDPSLISAGGGVYPRTAKSVPISPQVAQRLGLGTEVRSMSPVELLRAVLAAPVDLFWNGGIGTYVKASTESHADVGDKANDAIRIDGRDLRVRVVGEGGNLGLTQRGRIEAALAGGPVGASGARAGVKLNTDAIDNSAGVDCSDHEVNIKILLDHLVSRGELEPGDRNDTLLRMTDEVGRLVLRDNYEQNVVLSVEGAFAAGLLPAHRRFLDSLQRNGDIDRRLEALPSGPELDRRARDGGGLTMPELSVVIAHAKISLGREVLASALPDEEWVAQTLRGYFPAELGQRFGDHLADHPLRREIATTVLVNHVVGTGGLTFAFRAAEETGCDLADVVRAFVVATAVFGLPERAAAVEALDGTVEAFVQSRMRQEQQRMLDRSVRWLLHARPEGVDVPGEIGRFRPAVERLAPRMGTFMRGEDAQAVATEAAWFTERGVEEAEARRTVSLLATFPLLDVVEVAGASGRAVEEVAATWYELSHRYGIEGMLAGIAALPRTDRWQSLARAALRDDLYSALRDLTAAVIAHAGPAEAVDPVAAVEAWETAHAPAVRRARQTMGDLEGEPGAGDLAALSVGLRTLRTVLRAG